MPTFTKSDGGDDWRDVPMSAEAKQCWRVMARYGSGPPRRRSQFETQLDSDIDAPLMTGGRFGPLSSEDETLSVRVSPVQEALGSGGVSGTPVWSAVPIAVDEDVSGLHLLGRHSGPGLAQAREMVTLFVLRDPERRPPVLWDPIPEDILSTRPEVLFNLDRTDWPETSEVPLREPQVAHQG